MPSNALSVSLDVEHVSVQLDFSDGTSVELSTVTPVEVVELDLGGRGPQGDPGAAATVAVGTVTTGAAGSSASVTNVGTSLAAVLDFVIPRGATRAQGDPGAGVATSWNRHDFSSSIGAGPYTLPVTVGYDLVAGSLLFALDGGLLEPTDDYTLSGLVVTPAYTFEGKTLTARWQETPQ